MLTPFGKEIRKRRIDHEIKLGDLAERLEVSPTFLTAIETGRKSVPDDFVSRLARHMHLTKTEIEALERAADQSKTVYKIPVPMGTSASGREVAALFAKRFDFLTARQVERIRNILQNSEEENA